MQGILGSHWLGETLRSAPIGGDFSEACFDWGGKL